MAEGVGQAIEFIKSVYGPSTEHPVFVASLSQNQGELKTHELLSRDTSEIARFITKWDLPKRALYFCVSTIYAGKTLRNKNTAAEITFLHADIDFKDITDTAQHVDKILSTLEFPPSIIVASGNGRHCYWLLKEAVVLPTEISEERDAAIEQIESVLSVLSDLLGADTKVAQVQAYMRMPGTHNCKREQWTEVTVLASSERRYELDELEDWIANTSPKILRKERPSATPDNNPFLAAAAALGFKPSIDVEKRLADMCYMGGGDAAIHATQLAVSASLLNQGVELEEVVQTLVTATQAAAGDYGKRWNWRREENAIRKMCTTWLKKHPRQAITTQARPEQQQGTSRPEQQSKPAEQQTASAGGAVVNLAEARAAKTKKKPKEGRADVAAAQAVADGVVTSIRAVGQDILLSEGEVWLYAAGIWHVMTPADQQWIMTLIQEGFEALNEPLKTTNLNAAYKRLTEHPGLFKRDVEWSGGSLLICQNGVLHVESGNWSDHSPRHYARRKIGAEYKPGIPAPKFLHLVGSMFADRGVNAGPFIKVIQQWMGAALATQQLNREERKALILVGPSRTGKTELSRIIRLLIGDPVATPSVAEISERFGLSSLYECSAWIRDDAINEGDDLDPQRFKTIVTGEPIDIERKHKPAVPGVELSIPVLLTTNSLPKARDRSDAIFNRSLVLEMTNIVTESDAHKLRQEAKVPRGLTLGQHIFATEGPGILNWALEGLRELVRVGSYDLPDTVLSAIQRFKDDNNPVGEWARTAIVKSPAGKVSRHDLMCAYHGWQREQDGDEARAFGARAFFPRLRSTSPWMGESQDHSGKRFITGVHLSDEGLQLWDLHYQGPQLKGGSKGSSLTKTDVNKLWTDVPSEPKTTDEKPKMENENERKKPRF